MSGAKNSTMQLFKNVSAMVVQQSLFLKNLDYLKISSEVGKGILTPLY